MKNSSLTLGALVASAWLLAGAAQLHAQGTAFTYQGRLTSGTNVASGRYDLQFQLFTGGGTGLLPVLTTNSVPVSNGLFTVMLDFGPSFGFPGADRLLEIAVRTNGGGAFTILSPRQKLTPTPYAIYSGGAGSAVSLSGTLPVSQVTGTIPLAQLPGTVLTNNASGVNLNGSFTGNGAGLSNVWLRGGNAGANPANGAFLGTTDNLPLEIKVNGARVLRLEPAPAGTTAPNVIGGSAFNAVNGGAAGATIGGGGGALSIGPGSTNMVLAHFGTIGGGAGNVVGFSASDSTIGGGYFNTIENFGVGSTIAGGSSNRIQASVLGGGDYATIGGGDSNTNSGNYATVPGGSQNNASGAYSFAAGQRAKATNQGTFVWADSTAIDFNSRSNDQFLIRASGGVGIGTNNPQSALHVVGTVTADNFVAAAAGTEPPSGVTPILAMIWIKPATFIMGSPSSEAGRGSEEGPQTVVTITKGFWMGHHEVTQGEYQTVMSTNPTVHPGDLNLPVDAVDWHDATNYCRVLTLSERTAGRVPAGWGYRLPTEAEWEYACRAWTTTRFGYGDDLSGTILTNYAWFSGNSGSTTHPVAQKLANSWGLVDMHGNVSEWCQDWYGTYPGGSVADPQGPGTGSARVVRGGSWFNGASNCRSARRFSIPPAQAYDNIGFRVVLAPGQP